MSKDNLPTLDTWVRGDNPIVKLSFTYLDEDEVVQILDLTNGVVRSTLKRRWSDAEALAAGDSYPAGDITISTPLGGIALWQPLIEDTDEFPECDAVLDGEATARGALAATGTVTLVNGTANVAIASGFALTVVKKGDLLHITSANAENNGPFLVDSVSATHIVIAGYSRWAAETVVASVYRGKRGTPMRYRAPLRLDGSR